MLIQYAYIKPRSQFGKQCIFEKTDPVVEENILPQPRLMRDYIHRSRSHREVQRSVQLSLHEMQTTTKATKESGMLHLEGGWPKEINVKDEEAVLRFRRRVEKDDNWAPRMRKLTDPMERYILQNNRIDIYENYFDDLVPSALIIPRDVRITNVYTDPQLIVRPVNHLSWSSVMQNRLAASYSFAEFETKPAVVVPHSYIWDIENPNAPIICLESPLPLTITEFNPRNASMLISGLTSGQVCNWDIRIGNRPVQMSRRQFSHRNPVNQALWITSKTNTNFFSASTDGTIKWWDIRKLAQPTDELVMDLDNPLRADRVRAAGVTALHYEPIMSNVFLVGTENGLVINVKRKFVSPVEKLAIRFNCHVGPVIAIERNPFILKSFLTAGDWNVKIWADDTMEDCLISICEQDADLTGSCWSRSRCSVFFTVNAAGFLKVYDILLGMESPTSTFRISEESLTTIAPHENGELLAIGDHNGKIYLVKYSEERIVTKADKANLIAYLERCSRFEKTVDARLKEVRLADIREGPVDRLLSEPKEISMRQQKREDKEKTKERIQVKDERKKTKFRRKKTMKEDTFFDDLADAEVEFFQTVETEITSYPILEDADKILHLHQALKKERKRILYELLKKEEIVAPTKAAKWYKKKMKVTKPQVEPSTTDIEVEEEVPKTEVPSVQLKKPSGKRRVEKIPRKVPSIEVCADLKERKTKLRAPKFPSRREKKFLRDVTSPKLSHLAQKLAEPSAIGKRSILLEEDERTLANILADEVREAKRKVRAWQEAIASRKCDVRRVRTTDVIVQEKSRGKKRKADSGDDESPARDATESSRSDFRQLAKMRTEAWRSVSESEHETSRERGKGQARKLEAFHLGKYEQKGGTDASSSTLYQ